MFGDDDSVFTALQDGARGYSSKGALEAEMLRSIRAVSSGKAIFRFTSPSDLCSTSPIRVVASPHQDRLRNKRTLVAPGSPANAPNRSEEAPRRASYVSWSEPEGEL